MTFQEFRRRSGQMACRKNASGFAIETRIRAVRWIQIPQMEPIDTKTASRHTAPSKTGVMLEPEGWATPTPYAGLPNPFFVHQCFPVVRCARCKLEFLPPDLQLAPRIVSAAPSKTLPGNSQIHVSAPSCAIAAPKAVAAKMRQWKLGRDRLIAGPAWGTSSKCCASSQLISF